MRLNPLFTMFFGGLALAAHADAAPITQTITYQGELSENGAPKNGTIDVMVKIFDAAQSGSQFELATFQDVPVARGLFTLPITLDNLIFFEGGNWWIEVSVRNGPESGAAPYTTLLPRQLISAAPYAINADAVDGLSANDFMRASSANNFLTTDRQSAYKRTDFSLGGLAAPPAKVELASLTVTAPAAGSLVFRARGYCSMSGGLNGPEELNLAIGNTSSDAFTITANWGVLRAPEVPAGTQIYAYAENFSAERIVPVSKDQSVTRKLFAQRVGEAALAPGCIGTMMVEFVPGTL